jgi:hypothetical protein
LTICTGHPSAWIFSALSHLTGETRRTLNPSTRIFNTEAIHASIKERTADLSARRDTLSTSAELARFTRDASTRVRDALYPITDAPICTPYIDAGVRHTHPLPTTIRGVRAINPVTEVYALQLTLITGETRVTLNTDTRR